MVSQHFNFVFPLTANAITEGLNINRDNALVHRANWQSGTRNMVRMLRSAPAYDEGDSGGGGSGSGEASSSNSGPPVSNQNEDPSALYNLRSAEFLFKPKIPQVFLTPPVISRAIVSIYNTSVCSVSVKPFVSLSPAAQSPSVPHPETQLGRPAVKLQARRPLPQDVQEVRGR